jgi:Asp-tRNA(Asn)/Glu-tRNA(Gln) amidotransferase A subunit family amidase
MREVEALFSQVEAIVSPASSAVLSMMNVTGHPAIALNAGFAGGLPVGVMLTGRAFEEGALLRTAYALQQSLALPPRRPAGFD